MIIADGTPTEVKERYKLVRLDSCTDIECQQIVTADDVVGEAKIAVNGEFKTLSMGPGGFKIVVRDHHV